MKCIEIPNHCAVYQELTNTVLKVNHTSKTNKLIEKEIGFVVTRAWGWGEGELDKGNQKVQTSNYKINEY